MSWTCSAGIFSPTSLKPDPQLTNSQLSVTLFRCAFLSIGNIGFLSSRYLSKQQRLTLVLECSEWLEIMGLCPYRILLRVSNLLWCLLLALFVGCTSGNQMVGLICKILMTIQFYHLPIE
ncbi:hypothetical protein RDI58_019868 [Solanum bulbocastanum]|uniref:Uncharacterized protein n=1 Tax=Solanum bulbocastanum TaxID=147425 RepID=A0AAN8TBF8_SOLBU